MECLKTPYTVSPNPLASMAWTLCVCADASVVIPSNFITDAIVHPSDGRPSGHRLTICPSVCPFVRPQGCHADDIGWTDGRTDGRMMAAGASVTGTHCSVLFGVTWDKTVRVHVDATMRPREYRSVRADELTSFPSPSLPSSLPCGCSLLSVRTREKEFFFKFKFFIYLFW
jgi:hypothetical protein